MSEEIADADEIIQRQKLLDQILNEAPTVLINGKSRFLCKACNNDFYDRGAFRVHYNAVHFKLTYKCPVAGCGMWFNSKRSRIRHAANPNPQIHRAIPSKPIPEGAIIMPDDAPDTDFDVASLNSSDASCSSLASMDSLGTGLLSGTPSSTSSKKRSFPAFKRSASMSGGALEGKKMRMEGEGSLDEAGESPSGPGTGDDSSTAAAVANILANVANSHPTPVGQSDLESATTTTTTANTAELLDGCNAGSTGSPGPKPTLQEFLMSLVSTLKKQDPNGFFLYPMTDTVTTGCNKILDHLIDLSSIQRRVVQGSYQSLTEVREDLDLLYTNGMRYYPDKSPQYRQAAQLLKLSGDFLARVERNPDLLATTTTTAEERETEGGGEELLPGPGGDPHLVRVRADGRGSLAILQPHNRGFVDSDGVGSERVCTIGEQVGKLKSGTTTLSGYKEDRRNKVTPVSYLDYGPYCSFGPVYDSSGAHCTKTDSDLLLAYFGGDEDARGGEEGELAGGLADLELVIPEPGLGDDFSLYLLNAFTVDVLREERDKAALAAAVEETPVPLDAPTSTATVTTTTNPLQTRLDAMSASLGKLREANTRRLSLPVLSTRPSSAEQTLADSVVSGLAGLCAAATPGQLAAVAGLRRAMGVVGLPPPPPPVVDGSVDVGPL